MPGEFVYNHEKPLKNPRRPPPRPVFYISTPTAHTHIEVSRGKLPHLRDDSIVIPGILQELTGDDVAPGPYLGYVASPAKTLSGIVARVIASGRRNRCIIGLATVEGG